MTSELGLSGDSFTINMYDNGFMVEVSGRNSDGDWATAKVLCQNLEQVVSIVTEVSSMERE